MSFRMMLVLIVSVVLLFLWQGIYNLGPMKMRGSFTTVPDSFSYLSDDQIYPPIEYWESRAKVCASLPECFRPLTAWLILATHEVIIRGYLYGAMLVEALGVNRGPHSYFTRFSFKDFWIAPAIMIVVSIGYLVTFYLLGAQFQGVMGIVMLLGFGLTPLVGYVGLTEYDSIVLVYWSLFLHWWSRDRPDHMARRNFSQKRYFFLGMLWGSLGTLLMENVGIATAIAFFLLACQAAIKKIRPNPYWCAYLGATIAVVLTVIAVWALAHRHPDVSWVGQGNDPMAVWRTYSILDKFSDLIWYAYRIVLPSLGAGVFALILAAKFPLDVNSSHCSAIAPVAGAALVGFSCTCIAGLWLGAGYRAEWPRQLLPMGLISAWLFPALGLWFLSSIRSATARH